MRIGINVPDEILERFGPLKGTYNISQICRDAIKSRVESYEKAKKQANDDGMQDLADKFWIEYEKKTILDWQTIGRENAKKWAEGASLQDFEDLFHNISIHQRRGHEPGEVLGAWRIADGNRYENAEHQRADWFDRQFDLDETKNYYILAKEEYNRGWIAYLTAVWQMLQERITADSAARLKVRHQSKIQPEIPQNLIEKTK